MEDMNNLYEATKMGVSLLGDSCAPKFIGSKIYFFKLIDFFSRLILYLVFYFTQGLLALTVQRYSTSILLIASCVIPPPPPSD